jgi:heme exporter protein C
VRDLGGTHQQRARRSAVMALLAVLEVPLVHFSVRWWRPLHQQESVAKHAVRGLMLFTLFIGLICFTLLYVWMLLHRQRVLAMNDAFDDKGLDAALAERRNESLPVGEPR